VNRTLDFYEYAAFIIPGSILMVGLIYFFPNAHAYFAKEGVTFGELGIFVIIAYAVGQLLQGIGNGLERIIQWPFGGKASERALAGRFFDSAHYKRIAEALRSDPIIDRDIVECSASEYPAIIGIIYGRVFVEGKIARIDAFNGSYGLMRGLSAAFLVLIAVTFSISNGWYVTGVLVLLLLISLQRMNRYNGHYTKELFSQYLLLGRK
jgi:hypothetical protein